MLEMELDADYDVSDPFVNERLFCVSDDIETLDAAGSFQMDGESAVVEIKDNQTGDVLWSSTWQGSIDREAFTLSLENMRKDKEYVVCFTGTGINHAAVSHITTLIDSTNNQEDTIEVDLSLPLKEGNGRFYFSGTSSIFVFDLSFDLQS